MTPLLRRTVARVAAGMLVLVAGGAAGAQEGPGLPPGPRDAVGEGRGSLRTAGDFDGDGGADLLWRHTGTGMVYLMLMNGTAIRSAEVVYMEPDPAWRIQAAADFTGDGKADLLWRNGSNGMVYLIPMDGMTVLPGTAVTTEADPVWQIAGAGDLNGDGRTACRWARAPPPARPGPWAKRTTGGRTR
jgi:hypothetical protein